jgi:O-methyltransferase
MASRRERLQRSLQLHLDLASNRGSCDRISLRRASMRRKIALNNPGTWGMSVLTSVGISVVSKEDVRAAYRLIHGREPENEEVVASHVATYSSLSELRHAFIYSREFLSSRSIDGPLYVAKVPERYGKNQNLYEARGGLARREDATAFLSMGGAGDLPRYYFLSLAIDQIIREGIAGDFAELGVYRGATASILATMARRAKRSVYLLDTFEGFAERDLVEIDTGRGLDFADTSIDAVRALVGEENVHFVKGYFPESATNIPDTAAFSLVHIDCDLYAPFRSSLEYFWPRLSPGGFLIMHDYLSLHWAGAEKAVDEFFTDKAEAIIPIPDVSGTVATRKSRVLETKK